MKTLDNFSTGRRSNLEPVAGEIEIVEGDIQSYERVSHAVRGCEIVFHEAALPSVPRSVQDPLTSNASNVTGTLNVLLAARDADVRRVVFASSSSVYGANIELPKRETMAPLPISPYAVAKLAGEGYCRSFGVVYGLSTIVLRYFNVFGPRQDPRSMYAAVIPNFISAMLSGRPPVIFGDGSQSRDFTYVSNVIDANVLAIEAEVAAGEVYNIACGESSTLNDLVSALGELVGVEPRPDHRPSRFGDVKHSLADIAKVRDHFGYEPAVPFRQGLAHALEAFQDDPAGHADVLRSAR